MGIGLERLLKNFEEVCQLAWLPGSPVLGFAPKGALSHLAIVLHESPIIREISRSDFLPRLCLRRILPIMSMVTTPRTPRSKMQQSGLNTWLSCRSAHLSKMAQVSIGANFAEFTGNAKRAPKFPQNAAADMENYPTAFS